MNLHVKIFVKLVIIISVTMFFGLCSYGQDIRNRTTTDIRPAMMVQEFPEFTVESAGNSTPGYYLFEISPYLAIIYHFGNPVFYMKMPGGVRNFKPQPGGLFSYYYIPDKRFYVMNNHYQVIDTFEMKNGYPLDFYDMKILDNDKNLVFQWHTGENLNIIDADTTLVDLRSDFIDYAHMNSVCLDSDSNLLVSFRNMSEIIKINRETGDIIWRFGGANNEFAIVDDYRVFSAQHSVSRTKNGNLLFFDNGNGSENEFSRVVEYSLDIVEKTSTLIREIRHVPDIYTPVMGNVKELESGNILVGWGRNVERILATEYNNEGEVVNEIKLPESSLHWSYHVDQFFWRSSFFPISVDTLLIGSVEVGVYSISNFDVLNNSSSIVHIDSFYFSNEGPFELITDLPVPISPGENQSVEIKFKPLAVDNFECLFTILIVPDDTSKFLAAGKQVVIKGQCTGTSGKEPTIDKPSVIVYPNPFSDFIHINLLKPAVSVILFSMNGKIIWEGSGSGQIDIPVNNLKKGTFLLSLLLEDGIRETVTIVKD